VLPARTDPAPTITVVLPVRNEGAHIEAVLDDVLAQETGPATFEVLVVDGRSTDDTRARVETVARRDPRVRLLDNPLRLSSAARARGAAEARGRFVAYVDGHCRVPSRTLLSDMLALFERTGADCLARPQPLSAGDPGYVAQAVAAARSSRFGHSLASTIYDERDRKVSPVSAGAMYRREVFEKVGTFDPAFDACEDVEFNWRVEQAGLACWTSPRLAVAYEPRGSLRGLFRQMLRYGRGRARLQRKHPKAGSLESWVPALFVLGRPRLLLVPFLPRWAALAVAAPYALYVLLALAASVAAAAKRGWALLPLLPIVFPVIHVGLGLGYLLGRTERWPPAPPAPPAERA
jgi:succinoglycan biosynthesis protein ExoA